MEGVKVVKSQGKQGLSCCEVSHGSRYLTVKVAKTSGDQARQTVVNGLFADGWSKYRCARGFDRYRCLMTTGFHALVGLPFGKSQQRQGLVSVRIERTVQS